jgi:2-polyprenyl-3-methyl-5-hydroxy-6-metoxy-1,4-benzoquinol methylase
VRIQVSVPSQGHTPDSTERQDESLGTTRLEEYYNEKYAQDAQGSVDQDIISCPTNPSDRYEACVSWFLNNFEAGGNILEIGSGNGLVANSLLASQLAITSYVASEWAHSRLQGLKDNLRDPRARISQIDVENIPTQEYGRYDAVIMIAVIEHLVDPVGALRQVQMLLKPGGFVYIDTPNIAKYSRRLKLLFGRFPSTASLNEGLTTYEGNPVSMHDEGHLHYFTYRSLSLMLTQYCGFSRAIKATAYATGGNSSGRRGRYLLARHWPEMFSELSLVAYT